MKVDSYLTMPNIIIIHMFCSTHMQGLKDVTNNVHYENFRCQKLAGVSGVSSPDPKKFSAPSRYAYVTSSYLV